MADKAKGIHDHSVYKLGSILGSGMANKKTIVLDDFVRGDVQVPSVFDFDVGRKPFPLPMWGNADYGDCELAARANYLLRLQRAQTRTTPGINDDDVIALYKQMTGCVSPGDANDSGLATLDNLNQWRAGWNITKNWQIGGQQTRDYRISAYGMVDGKIPAKLRTAIFLFGGCLLAADMPITAQAQTDTGVWSYDDRSPPDAQPGSWGGHCIYSKRFDAQNIYVLTWGKEVRVTNEWWSVYGQEAYSVVDSFDSWFKFAHTLDVQGLIDKMKQNGIQVTV